MLDYFGEYEGDLSVRGYVKGVGRDMIIVFFEKGRCVEDDFKDFSLGVCGEAATEVELCYFSVFCVYCVVGGGAAGACDSFF